MTPGDLPISPLIRCPLLLLLNNSKMVPAGMLRPLVVPPSMLLPLSQDPLLRHTSKIPACPLHQTEPHSSHHNNHRISRTMPCLHLALHDIQWPHSNSTHKWAEQLSHMLHLLGWRRHHVHPHGERVLNIPEVSHLAVGQWVIRRDEEIREQNTLT